MPPMPSPPDPRYRLFSARSRLGGPDNALSQRLAYLRSRGEHWHDLTASNPTQVGLHWPEAQLAAAFACDASRYHADALGERSAREHVCAFLTAQGLDTRPDHTLLTASTSEAYGLLFKLLCDPGDVVLAPSPSYPLFESLARLEGVRLVPYPLRYDGRWHIDLPALRDAAAAHRARAVLMVSPNNPTGSRTRREELRALASLGVPLISDEVFAEYTLSPVPDAASSVLEAADDALVFRMAGLSKSALLPQAKLAWTSVAGPDGVVRDVMARLEHLADTYLSPSTLVQRALPALLSGAPEQVDAARARLLHNLTTLQRAVTDSALNALHVEAGWYACLRLPALMDEEAWALTLLDEARVQVQPGYFYDLPGGPHLVLSLLTPEAVFETGVLALVHTVQAHCA